MTGGVAQKGRNQTPALDINSLKKEEHNSFAKKRNQSSHSRRNKKKYPERQATTASSLQEYW